MKPDTIKKCKKADGLISKGMTVRDALKECRLSDPSYYTYKKIKSEQAGVTLESKIIGIPETKTTSERVIMFVGSLDELILIARGIL